MPHRTSDTNSSGRRKFRPYPKYKDSGVEWLGKIPSSWDAKRLKYLSRIIMGQSPPSDIVNTFHDGLPFLQGNADFGADHPSAQTFCPHPPKVAAPDDILISVRAPVGAINRSDRAYGIGRGLCAIRPFIRKLDHRYCNYFLLAARSKLDTIATGSTYDAVSSDDISCLKLPLPSIEEQAGISSFLNRETTKIDALIEKKEWLIELLQEKRTALITQAVTKGLDPTVPMKDSGIEWLGEIPKHWGISRLKLIASINDETLSENADPGFEIIYVDIGGVDNVSGIIAREEYLFHAAPSRARRIVRNGDIIISTVRTYLRAIAAIREPEPNLIVSTGFAVIRPRSDLNSDYAAYALRATYFVEKIVANSTGVSYPAIEPSKLSCFPIAYPDLAQQKEISDLLNRETAKIDKLIFEIQKAIDILKEYRQALISAAVSGKIDVREA